MAFAGLELVIRALLPEGLDILAQILSAKAFGLFLTGLDELRALDSIGETWIVLHCGGGGELIKSLSGLESELQNIQDLVRQAMEGEFKTRAAFLRARFLEDPST